MNYILELLIILSISFVGELLHSVYSSAGTGQHLWSGHYAGWVNDRRPQAGKESKKQPGF